MEQQGSSKKARVELGEGAQGRQEVGGGQAAGAGALVAVEGATARVELTMRIDKAKLHCPVCALPFKPPIYQFQCEAGHLACNTCHGQLPKNQCYACGHAGGYHRNTTVEDVVGWHRILCPYDVYGCRTYVTYHEVGDHQRACPCAPCGCPEPGCDFVGSPPMLRGHIGAEHFPIVLIQYGREWNLTLTAAQRWQAFVGKEDESLFLVSLGAHSAGAAVSLVCVRANGGAPALPQYTGRIELEVSGGNNGGGADVFAMESKVHSSALPAPEQPVFMGLNQQLLSCDTLALSIRIDLLRPAGAAAAVATPTATSTPARARSCRKQQ